MLLARRCLRSRLRLRLPRVSNLLLVLMQLPVGFLLTLLRLVLVLSELRRALLRLLNRPLL